MIYDTVDYAMRNLCGTFVIHKGTNNFVKVTNVYDDLMTVELLCEIFHISNHQTGVCKLSELSLNSPALGMANLNGNVCYVSRIPKREDWRQGLRRNNLSLKFLGPDFHMRIYDLNNIFKSLNKTRKGKLPSFIEASSARDDKARAFHREWVVWNNELFYKTSLVGLIKEGGAIEWASNKAYLEEYFLECTNA